MWPPASWWRTPPAAFAWHEKGPHISAAKQEDMKPRKHPRGGKDIIPPCPLQCQRRSDTVNASYVKMGEPVSILCPIALPQNDIDIQYIARGGGLINAFPSISKPILIWLPRCPPAIHKDNKILLDQLFDMTIKRTFANSVFLGGTQGKCKLGVSTGIQGHK